MLTLDKSGQITGSELCKTQVIARLFGVSVRRIQQLTQDGVLPTTQKGKYDLVPTVQNYLQSISDKAQSKARAASESALRKQKLEADIALKKIMSEYNQLKSDIMAGKYITVEEASQDYAQFFVAFKKFALALPGRIVSRVSGAIDPTTARRLEKEMQEDVTQLLRAFVVAGVAEEGNPDG